MRLDLTYYMGISFISRCKSLETIPSCFLDGRYFCPVVVSEKQADGLKNGEVYTFGFKNIYYVGNWNGYNSIEPFQKALDVFNENNNFDDLADMLDMLDLDNPRGVIGPDTSKRLADIFSKYSSSFKEFIDDEYQGDEYFLTVYYDFKMAFESASFNNRGAVEICKKGG